MFANVVSTPATFSPPVTTLFHNRAMTNPKAAASDVDIVLRTSDIEIFRSSAISNPRARWLLSPSKAVEARQRRLRLLLFRHYSDGLNPGTRILPLAVLLQGLHHVPDREESDGDPVERLHFHARLVRRFDGRSHGDPIGLHVERDARGGNWNRMGVREDLPHRLHRLKCGDLGGREWITLLDVPRTNRTDRRRL